MKSAKPEIYVRGYQQAVNGEVIDHEYAHRAHDAKNGWPGADVACLWCEGVAEFIRTIKEANVYYRGAGRSDMPSPTQMEGLINGSNSSFVTDYYLWAPWLYDLQDNSGEDITSSKCLSDPCGSNINYATVFDFKKLWNRFAVEIDDTASPTPGKSFTANYVSVNGLQQPGGGYTCATDAWFDMKRISVFHSVYSCSDSFPP